MLGKLPAPGRPTYMDYSWARAYCACKEHIKETKLADSVLYSVHVQ